MSTTAQLTPLHPAYPQRLRGLARAPASLRIRGAPLEAPRVIAVVGSRDATPEACKFAREFARDLCARRVVVASGGAEGIDAAAHRGALDAGGRTWAVAGTGFGQCYPAAHAPLYDEIGRGPGTMVWPFADGYSHRAAFLYRNRVLVALADAVVVVQAGPESGALHAARCARELGRTVWVVPSAPWTTGFEGSHRLLDEGASPLTSMTRLMESLDELPSAGFEGSATGGLSSSESEVLSALSGTPMHADAIALRARQNAQATAAALLTLALENVVVEGPPGFFRRRHRRNS